MSDQRARARVGCVALATFLSAGLASTARAQTDSATIRGSVSDPTGAVVPDAAVRLLDLERGSATAAATGSGGQYLFAGVRPGRYQIEVEKSGFKLVRVTGLTVYV